MNALSTDVFDDSKDAPELPPSETQDAPPQDSPPPLPQEGDLPPIENLTSDEATGVEQDGKAAIFADPQDLWRYRMARANGASHEEAESVGDSGVSRYGEVTATAQVPMVALPADTPGFQPGRLVKVSGDDGSVIAKLAEPMPRSDQLKGNSNIEVNPAAALAIGHQGGIQPVKWQFVSDPGDSQQVPVLDPKNIQPMSSRSTASLAGSGISLSDIQDSNVTGKNKDGSLNLSNGMTLYPDLSVTYERGGVRFMRHADGTVEKLGQVTSSDKSDPTKVFEQTLAKKGVLPPGSPMSEFPDTTEGWKAYKQAGINATQKPDEIMFRKLSSVDVGNSTGQAVLDKLPPDLQSTVKEIAEYRYPKLSSFALKSPYFQKVLGIVGAYNPDFNVQNYDAKQKLMNDFAAGKTRDNVNSLNAVIGHIGSLQNAYQDLGNTGQPGVNWGKNLILSGTGYASPGNFDIARDTVATEISRSLQGGAPNQTEINEWRDKFSRASSPQQFQAHAKEAIELLSSRLNPFYTNYKNVMGNDVPYDLLTPKAKDTLQKIGGRDILDQFGKGKPDPVATGEWTDATAQKSGTPPSLSPAPIQPQKVTPDAAAAAARRQLARNPNDEKANALLRALGQTP